MWILPMCLQTWFSAQASTQFPNFQWKQWNHVPSKLKPTWASDNFTLVICCLCRGWNTTIPVTFRDYFANIRMPESEPIRILIAGEEVFFHRVGGTFLQIVMKKIRESLPQKSPPPPQHSGFGLISEHLPKGFLVWQDFKIPKCSKCHVRRSLGNTYNPLQKYSHWSIICPKTLEVQPQKLGEFCSENV